MADCRWRDGILNSIGLLASIPHIPRHGVLAWQLVHRGQSVPSVSHFICLHFRSVQFHEASCRGTHGSYFAKCRDEQLIVSAVRHPVTALFRLVHTMR